MGTATYGTIRSILLRVEGGIMTIIGNVNVKRDATDMGEDNE